MVGYKGLYESTPQSFNSYNNYSLISRSTGHHEAISHTLIDELIEDGIQLPYMVMINLDNFQM